MAPLFYPCWHYSFALISMSCLSGRNHSAICRSIRPLSVAKFYSVYFKNQFSNSILLFYSTLEYPREKDSVFGLPLARAMNVVKGQNVSLAIPK